jgi:hypothetical protein
LNGRHTKIVFDFEDLLEEHKRRDSLGFIASRTGMYDIALENGIV